MAELTKEAGMAKIINCECGYVARGEDMESVSSSTWSRKPERKE